MKAKLVHTNERQNYYRLSEQIKCGRYGELDRAGDIICISSPHVHAVSLINALGGSDYENERMVFLAYCDWNDNYFVSDYAELCGDRQGCEDSYYLQELCKINNLTFEGIEE